MPSDPRFGVTELSQLYATGAVSPVEIVQETLARIERLDARLNSYLTVTAESALRQARQAETEIRAGRARGPLHGVPYAAKDLLDTRGIRTTVGSKIMADRVPDRDAAIIERLSAAGAVLLGKTGMHEWAYGITSANPHFGPVRNPWDTERIPGGSSGGSAAALAAGLCAFSLGSDTGGSIRIPAAICGIAGLKPTFGSVSRAGAFPLGDTLDTLGPFALRVEDLALVYAAIADFEAEPRWRLLLDGIALGVPTDFYWQNLAPDVEAAARDALRVFESLGAELEPVEVPDIETFNDLHRLILLAEATSVHRSRLAERREDFGEDVRALLEQGLSVLATDYLEAQRARRAFRRDFGAAFERVDALLAPAVPVQTAGIGELEIRVQGKLENVRLATTRNIRALNLTALPVLSVPCGFQADGLPVGLQIVGPEGAERKILKIGRAYEKATDWHLRTPPMAR